MGGMRDDRRRISAGVVILPFPATTNWRALAELVGRDLNQTRGIDASEMIVV